MSIVQQYEKCPQCGGIYDHCVDLITGEDFRRCYRCGKKYTLRMAFDKENKVKKDENGKIIYSIEDKEGFGVISAVGIHDDTHMYYLAEQFSEETQTNFKKLLAQECIDKTRTYMTRWDKEQNKVIAVYGKLPESFEEYIKGDKT